MKQRRRDVQLFPVDGRHDDVPALQWEIYSGALKYTFNSINDHIANLKHSHLHSTLKLNLQTPPQKNKNNNDNFKIIFLMCFLIE